MYTESEKSNKDLVAAGISFLVMGLIIVLLYLWRIIIPIPPFPPTATIIELEYGGTDFGNYTEGQGNSDSPSMGDGQGVKSNAAPVKSGSPEDNNYLGNEADDPTAIKSSPNPTDGKPSNTQPSPDDELTAALSAFQNSKGDGGGDGNAGKPGNLGTPDGVGGKGQGNEPGPGPGISLKGRKIVKWPDRVTDSREEGKVVVGIVVDAQGNVIKAEPGEPGSTTTSPMLYMKARQAAMTAKFSPSPEGAEEQYGTITFVFVL
jgi:TonB family protein